MSRQCNACWQGIQGDFVVTECSHIFCNDCGVAAFESTSACPVCSTALTTRGIAKKTTTPHAGASLLLAGMQPDQVVQALSSSLSFSATQSEMAIEQAEKHSAERVAAAQREARSAKLATENQLNDARAEVANLQALIGELSGQLDELRSKKEAGQKENLVLSDRLNEHLREKNRLVEENFQLKLKLSRAEDSGDGGDAKWTGAPGGFSLFAATKAAQAQAVP